MDLSEYTTGTELPRIMVADCETDPFKKGRHKLDPFIWGFYDGTEYREFRETEKFVAFIGEQDGILYAHNGGKFDWHFILPHMDPLQPLGIINGRLSKFKIGKCELRDSFNILPVSLAAWQKDKIDYEMFESDVRERPENMAKIQDYLKSDCVYLFDMVSQFIAKYGLHLTQAGAAMTTWESMTNQKAPSSTPEYYDAFHRYYFGGRVQCFQTGIKDGNFVVADINSAYPRAMLDKHPLSIQYGTLKNLTQENACKWIDKHGPGMVFVSCWATSRGAFPFRADDNALYFPDDDVRRLYHVTGWEFLAGIETGTVKIFGVTEIHVFTGGATFADYINHFYKIRLEAQKIGDKGADLFAKIFMNGLYGKFASDPRAYANYLNVPREAAAFIGKAESATVGLDLEPYHYNGNLGPWSLAAKDLDPREMRFYNIATSASITGFVRAYLWRTLCRAVEPIYCDTDSIAAVGFGSGVPFGGELGQWKDEGTFDRFAVGGRKMYAFRHASPVPTQEREWKLASKGVRLTADQIEKVAAGEVVEYETDKPTFSIHHAPRLVNRKVRAVHRSISDVKKKKTKKV